MKTSLEDRLLNLHQYFLNQARAENEGFTTSLLEREQRDHVSKTWSQAAFLLLKEIETPE